MRKISEVKDLIKVKASGKGSNYPNFISYVGGYKLRDTANTKTKAFIAQYGEQAYNNMLKVRYNLSGANSIWLSKDYQQVFAYIDKSDDSKGGNAFEGITEAKKGDGDWYRLFIGVDFTEVSKEKKNITAYNSLVVYSESEFTQAMNNYKEMKPNVKK